MKLLVDLRDLPALKAAGIDASAETFRIADVARGSAVQRALAESAARATLSDPTLAELARREQDAQQRFATLSDLLNRLLSVPPAQQLPKIIADLRRDIDALHVQRDKLKIELDRRFPDYAELISPKPTTLAQTQAALAASRWRSGCPAFLASGLKAKSAFASLAQPFSVSHICLAFGP